MDVYQAAWDLFRFVYDEVFDVGLWTQCEPGVKQMGGGACLCVFVCLFVRLRAHEHAFALSFSSFMAFAKLFFFLFKPCCFATPWAFKPLGGRYGLVFEFPAARREAHKQLAHIQFTVSPAHAAHTHARTATQTLSVNRRNMYEGVLFSLSFFIPEDRKSIWGGKREDEGKEEVMRCGKMKEEEEGKTGRAEI